MQITVFTSGKFKFKNSCYPRFTMITHNKQRTRNRETSLETFRYVEECIYGRLYCVLFYYSVLYSFRGRCFSGLSWFKAVFCLRLLSLHSALTSEILWKLWNYNNMPAPALPTLPLHSPPCPLYPLPSPITDSLEFTPSLPSPAFPVLPLLQRSLPLNSRKK